MSKQSLKVALAAGLAVAGLGLAAAPAFAASDEFCIMTQNIRETRAIDDQTILVRMTPGKEWRKISLVNRCSGLKTQGFAYSTSINKLCKSDALRVIEPVGATCMIDRIETITEAEAKELENPKKPS
jgi:hypothetical protein